jgi:hypothetical protein
MGTSLIGTSRLHYDTYGHKHPICTAPTLPGLATAASVGTVAGIGAISAGAGTGATMSYVGGTSTGATAVDTIGTQPNDGRGQFVITTAGTPAAGILAQVVFEEPYTQPVQVVVSAVDTTASPNVSVAVGAVLASAAPGATTGFSIVTSQALTAAHGIQISYHVEP